MYFSLSCILSSLEKLETVHPFYINTFLVCKKHELPIGEMMTFDISTAERAFLREYYQPSAEDTDWYFRVSRLSDKSKQWLTPDYPSSGSQSLRTREFGDAFLHEAYTQLWGWKPDYVDVLRAHLHQDELIPAFELAVWLYRHRDWSSETGLDQVVEVFFDEFLITEEEKDALFNTMVPSGLDKSTAFQETRVSWKDIRTAININPPPDATVEEGGILTYLELRGVGPARQLSIDLRERLNLLTGDNGLGKTFILECAWWALSGQWADLPAHPREDAEEHEPRIAFRIAGETIESEEVSYDWQTQSWESRHGRASIPGLLIYAGVDGSFAVWDPAKHYWQLESASGRAEPLPRPLILTKEEVWDGRQDLVDGRLRVHTEGLIRDWIKWQNNPAKHPFDILKAVIRRLSPPDLGVLEPGEPTRLGFDARDIPTLKHPYGEVPILHAAAGVRRIVALAYLLVWAWDEHKKQSQLVRSQVQTRMVVLIDEVEAHLHPLWQRAIVPALIEAINILEPDLEIQLLIATHSPLIMVSVEPIFDNDIDGLFHLDLIRRDLLDYEVEIKELPFVRHGRVDSWLMSEIFELGQARSLEAEKAIEDAKHLQLQDEPSEEDIREVSDRLMKYLADNDGFWPRWTYFATKHGVTL